MGIARSAPRPPVFNNEALALHISALTHPLSEWPQETFEFGSLRWNSPEGTYPIGFCRLLRLGGERRGEDT
jgi:hypothetical protein